MNSVKNSVKIFSFATLLSVLVALRAEMIRMTVSEAR